MKTLLQINTVVNSGSTGRIAEEIGQTAISHGWKSYIAYGRNERSSQSELLKIGNEWDIRFHGLQTRLFDKHGFGSKNATIQLVEQIQKINPDIIHLHNIHGYYLNIEILFRFLKTFNKPVVWTLHDCWPFTGHCVHFDRVNCNKWKTQCSNCPQTKEYPASLVFDRSRLNFLQKKELFTSLDNLTLIPVSRWLNDLLNDSFLNKYQKKTIHNGVDTQVFKPIETSEIRKRYRLENKFILLGVASIWTERKGLNDFVNLSKQVDKNFQIILVGLNQKQIKSLPSNIIGIQRTENTHQLAELYSMADLTLNLSSEETFGMTTVEGFACGTPGIVYNCTASPELIDNSTGTVVEQGNISELINAINKIQSIGKIFYTKKCRERALAHYKKDDRYQEYFKLYESLLKEK